LASNDGQTKFYSMRENRWAAYEGWLRLACAGHGAGNRWVFWAAGEL